MDSQSRTTEQLQDAWRIAVQRAIEECHSPLHVSKQSLNDAEGLHVKAGIKAGAWTNTGGCGNACTDYIGCQ